MSDALQLIELFPQHEDWSLQTMRLLAQVAVGGADLFECARTAARIGDTTDDEVWQAEWSRTAREIGDWGRAEAAAGHRVTAAAALFRSCSYWRHSEFFLDTADPRREQAYRAGTASFQAAVELSDGVIERIHVPFEGQTMDGYILRPDNCGARRPTVLFLGGADSWAEELVFLGGNQFPARGINLVVVDTPGRGSSLRFKQLYSRPELRGAGGRRPRLPGAARRRRRRPHRAGRRELRRLLRAAGGGLRAAGQGGRGVVRDVEHPHRSSTSSTRRCRSSCSGCRVHATTPRHGRSWPRSRWTVSRRRSPCRCTCCTAPGT